MKKLFLAFLATVLLSSCTTLTTISTKEQAPRFTTMDEIVKLEVGMSLDEVIETLGSKPYDLHTLSFDENQTVYNWYYKKIERKEDPKVLKTKKGATSGEEVIDKQQEIYITFDDDGKLVKAITDTGKGIEVGGNTGNQEQEVKQEKKPFWKLGK